MGNRVSLFVTCIVDQLFPSVGLAIASVLERVGCEVEFLEAQTCCGQPAFNSGYRNEARQVARHFLRTFRDAEYVIAASGSCCTMVSHHYQDLLTGSELDDAHSLSRRTFEFSTFLTEVLNIDDVGARFDGVVTYHDSCHALRELKIKSGPRRLLAKVAGLTLKEMSIAEECCGFGGTFSVKFPGVSSGMARTKIESIEESGASAVVSIDSSCLMQLRGALLRQGSTIRTLHLAEVLASQ